ncbi:MAG: class I SAM-dependent methyltransferase [Candidatus Paceibacterota bacterium]
MIGLWWCRRHAVSFGDVVSMFKGDENYHDFIDTFRQEMDEANRRAGTDPKEHLPAKQIVLYYAAEYLRATKVIETGVASGWSSLTILLSLEKRDNSLLISTNTVPEPGRTQTKIGRAVPARLRNHWKLILKPDSEGVPEALEVLPEIDMCHYDSDKTYAGRLRTYRLLWGALRPGGVFFSDDVDDNLGFRNFARSVGAVPVVYATQGEREKYAGMIRKLR